jgi:UDP-glucose 4-epimerase
MQPTVLVTGGAGFIGSHLVAALVEAGEQVRILDDFSTGQRENLAQLVGQIEVLEGSVTEPCVVAEAVHGTRTVYHLAALASVQQSVDAPRKSHEVCATGTLTVLDEARRVDVKRVVYAASSSAYGNGSDGALTEDEPLDPLSPYAAAKLAGEHYCRSFTATFGLETVRLRFFNIFGPRQRSDSPYSGVIALFAAALTANRRPTLFGDGLQSRDFTEVGNAVQALRLAAAAPAAVGQVYNVGTGQAVTLLELLGELNTLLGTSVEPILGPPRAGDVRHSRADISRARRDLGYAPSVSFAAGLRRLLGK